MDRFIEDVYSQESSQDVSGEEEHPNPSQEQRALSPASRLKSRKGPIQIDSNLGFPSRNSDSSSSSGEPCRPKVKLVFPVKTISCLTRTSSEAQPTSSQSNPPSACKLVKTKLVKIDQPCPNELDGPGRPAPSDLDHCSPFLKDGITIKYELLKEGPDINKPKLNKRVIRVTKDLPSMRLLDTEYSSHMNISVGPSEDRYESRANESSEDRPIDTLHDRENELKLNDDFMRFTEARWKQKQAEEEILKGQFRTGMFRFTLHRLDTGNHPGTSQRNRTLSQNFP